jgi:hypothetical protein
MLPLPLRWWYERGGNRQGLVDGQNSLLRPDELESEEGGKAVFYSEYEGVYLWATLLEGDDPPVWGRLNDPGEPWTKEGMTLSEFLIQACLVEGLWQAPIGASASCVEGASLAWVTGSLRLVPLAPWHWPAYPARLYASSGAFVFVCPNGDGRENGFSVWAGAKNLQPLAYLREVIDEGWEYSEI